MTDFERHPVGTQKRIDDLLKKWDEEKQKRIQLEKDLAAMLGADYREDPDD